MSGISGHAELFHAHPIKITQVKVRTPSGLRAGALSDERVDASERAVRSPTHRISYIRSHIGRLGAIAYAILRVSLSFFLSLSYSQILTFSHTLTRILSLAQTHTQILGSWVRRLVDASCLIARDRERLIRSFRGAHCSRWSAPSIAARSGLRERVAVDGPALIPLPAVRA